MKKLSILVFSLLFSVFSSPSPISASAAQPQPIGNIDTSNPSWGEDIIIPGRVDAQGNISVSSGIINVGPKTDQLQFPDLTEIKNGITQALPALLPSNLLGDLKLPAPLPLPGKIFHPVCGVKVGSEEKPVSGEAPSSGVTEIKTLPDWPVLLGVTKLAQAIGVPGFGSGVQFEESNPLLPGEEQNAPGNCKTVSGVDGSNETVPTVSSGTTSIDLNILETILGFLKGIFSSGEPAQIIVRAKKFIPGEVEFSQQTSDKMGFLRGFCPESLCPPLEKIYEQEDTPYQGDADSEKQLEYKGVAGTREGFDCLQASLYPEEIKPAGIDCK